MTCGQPRACPGSWGSPPVRRCLEHLGRHLGQVPEMPLLKAKDQKLYSELVPSDWASPPKGAPSHLAEEPHFRHLYLQPLPFSHYQKVLMTGESGIIDLPFHSSSSFFTTTVRHAAHITAGAAPITPCQSHTPSFPHSWSQETPSGMTSPPQSHLCLVENHGLTYSGWISEVTEPANLRDLIAGYQ